jgi:hypothetical protein
MTRKKISRSCPHINREKKFIQGNSILLYNHRMDNAKEEILFIYLFQ